MLKLTNEEVLTGELLAFEISGSSSGIESSLLKVSGIFSTLIQLLPDIVASEPQGLSLLVPSKDHDPQWMHVALQIDGDEIFVLGLSATRISSERVHGLAQQLTRFLLLKHSSLMAAALSSSTKDLDQLFGNLLYETLFDKMTAIKLDSVLNEVPCLLLPPDVHFQVEDALNQFESGDFQVSLLFLGTGYQCYQQLSEITQVKSRVDHA